MSSLSEELSKLTNPKPQIFDNEDDEAVNVEPLDETHFIFQKSDLRSRTAPLLEDVDPAYVGRKVSRKSRGLVFNKEEPKKEENGESGSEDMSDFESESSDNNLSEEADEDLNESNISDFKQNLENEMHSDNDNKEEEKTDDEEDQNDQMTAQFSNIDVNGEIDKGNAIKAQKEIWHKLCESRIKLQKILIASNKLPQTDNWRTLKNSCGEELPEVINKSNDSLKLLLNSLINLHGELSARNLIEEKSVNNTKISTVSEDEEIPSDSENEENDSDSSNYLDQKENVDMKQVKRKCQNQDYSEILSKRFKLEKTYRNTVIQKWDDKVRLSTGRMTQKSFNAFGNSAVKQIEQILQDKSRLIRRTQLKRSAYRVLGKPEFSVSQNSETSNVQEPISKQDMILKDYDPEIFDDDDFYRQLLKDIIQSKSFGIDPSIVRKQMELQKIRNKMKRKVDTKASKGRKLRYDIHPKLVNYMAPVQTSSVSDEARENLLKCLFGKSVQ